MRPAILTVLFTTLLPIYGQEPAPDQVAPAQEPQKQSVLEVKPGTEALKDKDFYKDPGYVHPFRRMPGFVLVDQKRIWTSPFHTGKKDIKYWAIFGGLTVGLIAADRHIQHAAPTNSTLVHVGNDASYLGAAYTLIPISAGFYFIGSAKGSDRFRETGLLAFETMVDVTIVQVVMKSIANRERPLEGSREGKFFKSPNARYSSSFPSGHSMQTFALASVFAHEYPHKWWLSAIIYGYGTGVAAARLAANKHFPGDVVAGGAIGWFIGDYVYGKRHNSDVGPKRGLARKILSHVRIGD